MSLCQHSVLYPNVHHGRSCTIFRRKIGSLTGGEHFSNSDGYDDDEMICEVPVPIPYLTGTSDKTNPWKLPDITSQLRDWNGGKEILFTKEYEEKLLLQVLKEDDAFEDFMFNGIFSDDEHSR